MLIRRRNIRARHDGVLTVHQPNDEIDWRVAAVHCEAETRRGISEGQDLAYDRCRPLMVGDTALALVFVPPSPSRYVRIVLLHLEGKKRSDAVVRGGEHQIRILQRRKPKSYLAMPGLTSV